MNKTLLILDLDGVLITTPPWRADEIGSDGYAKFNQNCVHTLNQLLAKADFEIWLSSTRRTVKSLEEFNHIFKYRQIENQIFGFLPFYENCKNRKEEILEFLKEHKPSRYLILDDNKSLHGLDDDIKGHLVLTDLLIGFNNEKLKEATQKL